ncbi:VirB4-like conjugal transfer ATPase, CD1110 family [Clostridium butyricum]|uniref:VirB4-like conjugal transfer ATPase, CD1110 family n=1 Tax=Clostridium butyricum TaxID=1492 RepID=UPI0022E138F0|nr:hypothetical protein [Clostridium butyricum]MDU3597532.1 hypothetical protein [Clostridium butyricum]
MSLKSIQKSRLKTQRNFTIDDIPLLDYDNSGIFEVEKNKYTATIEISDINYALIKEDERKTIFCTVGEILNYLNAGDECQLNLINSNIEVSSLEKRLSLELKDDGFDKYRKELNGYLLDTCTQGSHVKKNIYLTFKISAKHIQEARNKLNKIIAGISSLFKGINANIIKSNTEERLQVLHDILRMGHENEFEYNKDELIDAKDIIAPRSAKFKDKYFKFEDNYGRVLKFTKNAKSIRDNFANDLMELDLNMNISIHIVPIAIPEAITAVDNKITDCDSELVDSQTKAAQNGRYAWIPPRRLVKAKQNAEDFRDLITESDQRVFKVTFLISHYAKSYEKLNEDTDSIKNVCGKHVISIGVFKKFQELAAISTLPLCCNYVQEIDKILTTEATTAAIMPFNSTEFMQHNGTFMARNGITGKPILLQRNELTSGGTEIVLARPGSGKSFKTKMEIFFEYLTNSTEQILLVDPEDEYRYVVKALHGTQLDIDVGSKTYLNPFDLVPTEDTDFINEKSEFIITFINTLMRKDELSTIQESIIDKCIRQIYKPLIEHDFDPEYTPILDDLRKALLDSGKEEGIQIGEAIEIYCTGSLNLFSHKTNVDSKNRLMNFNIKKLNDRLKPAAYQVILETIWNRVCKGREEGITSFIDIDEFHLLFTSEMAMQYVIKSVKRYRKYQSYCNLISQNCSEILETTAIATLISNSSIITLMNQSSVEREKLKKHLNLSDLELSYCTNSDEGTGIMLIEQIPVPFDARMPRNLEIYKLLTTKASDINKYKKEEKEKQEVA